MIGERGASTAAPCGPEEDFLYRVTHELRAPLAAISAALEVLGERAGGPRSPQERPLLEACLTNAGRLRRLVDDLQDFSCLQQGLLRLRPAPCRPASLVTDAVAGLEPWAQAEGLALRAVRSEAPPVRADRARAIQILTNLLSNAIKATPAGGLVEAGAAPEEGLVRFWVRDTGCGIAKADQRRIFRKFVRLQPETGCREGIGLGLAIVAELVARHGGSVAVDSDRGRGATFSFTLPLA